MTTPFPTAEPPGPKRHGRPEPPPPPARRDPLAPALLIPLAVGCAVAVLLGVYGRLHEPTGYSINLAGFSSGLYVKAWLTTAATLLGIAQAVSAAALYGKLSIEAPPSLMPLLHRWSGRLAVLLTVPVAVHCLFALGFQYDSPRVLAHSLLGCAFYGAFVTKMLSLTKRGLPGWAVPVVGSGLFVVLVASWLTTSLWVFSTQGLRF